jgi:hypothetical protein
MEAVPVQTVLEAVPVQTVLEAVVHVHVERALIAALFRLQVRQEQEHQLPEQEHQLPEQEQ